MPSRSKDPYSVDPRKLPSGHWKGRVVLYDRETGKRRELTKTFATKREAKNWAEAEAERYREDPHRKPPSEETVGDYLKRWFPQMIAQRALRQSSIARYEVDLAHVHRLIGACKLKSLTPLDIQNVYTTLLNEGRAAATVRHVRVIIHGALQDAVAWDLVAKDPARGTKAPKVPRRELQIPSMEQAQDLLKAAQSDRLFALWMFLALTGCRRGEALALKWDDIDWERRVVTIQRTLSGYGAKRTANPPKTLAGLRIVALSDYLLDILSKHRHQQKLERLAAGSTWQEGGWVFTTRNGTWFAGGHVYDYFKRLVRRAGLPDTLHIHDLRHAMASYWIANGVPVKVVSERLGHANIAITMEIYGHLLPNMQANAADKMDALLLGETQEKRAADGPQKHPKTS